MTVDLAGMGSTSICVLFLSMVIHGVMSFNKRCGKACEIFAFSVSLLFATALLGWLAYGSMQVYYDYPPNYDPTKEEHCVPAAFYFAKGLVSAC